MPTPTPTNVIDKTVDTARAINWGFWLGHPLKIALIIVIAVLIAVILRIAIRRFARSIANDADHRLKSGGKSRSVEIFGQDPTARERRAQRARTVGSLLRNVTSIVVGIIAAAMVLSELGVDLAPILASAGIVGIALGFGAQALVKDYLSGIFMVIEDQYGIGDFIDVGECQGTVEEVGLRITRLRDSDGTLWHVRNGEILRVGNSSQGWSVAVLDLAFPYDADDATIDQVIADTNTRLAAIPELTKHTIDKPTTVGIQDVTGEAVTVRVTINTKPSETGAVSGWYRNEFRHQLSRRGLAVPLAQATLVRTETAESESGPSDNTETAHKETS